MRCPSVYICDPGTVGGGEFDTVRAAFRSRGYVIRNAVGRIATVREVGYATQHVPLEFIFFSTHCGEVEGCRVTESFKTADGKEHVIVYDTAQSYAPKPGEDMIEVMVLKTFVSLDGVAWDDDEGKEEIDSGAIFEEYVALDHKDPDNPLITYLNSEDIKNVKWSDALKMADSNFIPMPQYAGGNKHPVIFNNSCSSWQGMATKYAYAGACSYIGTSVDIPNPIAVSVAGKFAEKVVEGRTIGHSLYESQKKFVEDLGYTPYLMHGYLFTKLEPIGSLKENTHNMRIDLEMALEHWQQRIKTSSSDNIRQNEQDIIDYLADEIARFDNPKGQRP